eukprot:scaffold10530_cov96-Isochrysis_galbana.AAC.1
MLPSSRPQKSAVPSADGVRHTTSTRATGSPSDGSTTASEQTSSAAAHAVATRVPEIAGRPKSGGVGHAPLPCTTPPGPRAPRCHPLASSQDTRAPAGIPDRGGVLRCAPLAGGARPPLVALVNSRTTHNRRPPPPPPVL